MLQSKTFHLVLNEILSLKQVANSNFTNIEELNAALEGNSKPDLIFLDKESAVKAGLTPFEYVAKIRKQFNGPILLISTEQDINEIQGKINELKGNTGYADQKAECMTLVNKINELISAKQ